MVRSFFGGIHPEDRKSSTRHKRIEILPPPPQIILPMSMHIGAPCEPLVKVGSDVKMGQVIGRPSSPVSAPIHSSVSGKVSSIEARLHPNGTKVLSVVIDNNFEDFLSEDIAPHGSVESLTADQLMEIITNAGIVGLGGATFPTHTKIKSGIGKLDTIIINCAECEPYITSDHRLMLEAAEEIIGGTRVLMKIFNLKTAVIAVESNKYDAIEHIQKTLPKRGSDIKVKTLHTKYPQGAEKQLIQTITGREVPPGQLPASVGCGVFNADTTSAIHRAVTTGMPLIRRIVTVSGSAVSNPKNLSVRIGTPFSALFEATGGFKSDPFKIIMGGPMMGVAQYSLNVPVIKGTNALLAFSRREDALIKNPVCIRCGKCVNVCPMLLYPVYMYMYEQKNMLDECEKLNVSDCIECGCCSYVCPGRLHLVQSFRTAKQKINDAKQRKKVTAK